MRLDEIAASSRKIINKLQHLYIRYTMNSESYTELMNYLLECYKQVDQDILREAEIIKTKLQTELIKALTK